MKKILSICLIIALCFSCLPFSFAENTPKINDITYDLENHFIWGYISSERQVYLRITFFMEDDSYFIICWPVNPDGTFELSIYAPCDIIIAQLTDKLNSYTPDTYEIFDIKEVEKI